MFHNSKPVRPPKLSCDHFPDKLLLESLNSGAERLSGYSQLSQRDNEENDTSVTSGTMSDPGQRIVDICKSALGFKS